MVVAASCFEDAFLKAGTGALVKPEGIQTVEAFSWLQQAEKAVTWVGLIW